MGDGEVMPGLLKRGPGRDQVGLAEVPRPEPAPGQAVLEIIATGICGTDLHIVADEYASTPPLILGHETTGIVIAVGDPSDAHLLGTRVAPETFFHVCGTCPHCRAGRPNLCPHRRSIGTHVNGGFAPFLLIPVRNLHPVAPTMSDPAGALYEPLACVAQALCDPAVSSPGDTALVVGPGAMGILAAQVLRAQGAHVVVSGTARDRLRLDVAAGLGLETVEADGLEAYGPLDGFDVVADCSGAEAGIRAGLRATRKGGRYVQIGLAGRPITLDIDLICLRELVVSTGFASTPRSWRRTEALIATGAVQLDPLVSDVLPLAEWQVAFERTARADGLKIMLDPRRVV